MLPDDRPIGIVGVDHNGDARFDERRHVGDLDHVMAGKFGHTRVLGIGRRQGSTPGRARRIAVCATRICVPGPATTCAGDGAA
jgi:hypothetical protein